MATAAPIALAHAGRRRASFARKPVFAALLVALADALLYGHGPGTVAALFALALLAATVAAHPISLRRRDAAIAAGAALLLVLVLADDPSLVAALLFALAATMAVLLPRTQGFDDGWRWARRVAGHLLFSPVNPLFDAARLRAARRRAGTGRLGSLLPLLPLPLLGSALFLGLFSAANPLISDGFSRMDPASLAAGISFARLLFWLLTAVLAWSFLRPARWVLAPSEPSALPPVALPALGPASVGLSLLAFNAVFALENGLDLAFLWSGARLPDGLNYAEYAHRGAYPLIATALLAALFVLVALRPGTPTAASAPVRRLVYLWIGQNLILVASTMLRTASYIEAYSLTRLRIAALAWMALVAVGLVLICWRIFRARSGAWLINANLAAAMLVLAAASVVDLGAVAAAWNVRHAREAGGRGTALDLCYLSALGPSALLPVIDLESRPLPAPLRPRVEALRNEAMIALAERQADWRRWTFRNARRLAAARDRIVALHLPMPAAPSRGCAAPPAFDSRTRGM